MERDFAQRAECSFCQARFSHRSSLARHLRNNCNQSRQHPLRRKACYQCVSNKTRCNLNRPRCSRCHMRNTSCSYTDAASPDSSVDSSVAQSSDIDLDVGTNLDCPAPHSKLQQEQEFSATFGADLLDSAFPSSGAWDATQPSNLTILPFQLAVHPGTYEISGAQSRIDSPGLIQASSFPFADAEPYGDKVSLALATHSMELLFRVLRTWPKMLAEEFQVPALFHPNQITHDKQLTPALANCITLTKLWHGKREGAEEMVRRTIMSELENIVNPDKARQLDEAELVSVLQSVVIYAIMLICPATNFDSPRADHNEIFRKVEQLVWHVVRTGLFLQEEKDQIRPTWEAWVHVTSKRRAVLSLYLLHWAYSVLYRVPCFDCRDLGFMPAPAAKMLWQARSEEEWNRTYVKWLARWDCRGYLQGELGDIRPGVIMNKRAERWFEETDEFGFLMISIVNATDYEAPSLKVLAP